MAYKTIDEEFWTDPKVIDLDVTEKLLFLYLITNPQAHYSGIYYLPKSFISEEMGINGDTIDKALITLEDTGLIQYDSRVKIVWVVNMARRQMKQGNKTNMIKGIVSQLKQLHNSKLVNSFAKVYGYLADTIAESVTEEEEEQEEETGIGKAENQSTPNADPAFLLNELSPDTNWDYFVVKLMNSHNNRKHVASAIRHIYNKSEPGRFESADKLRAYVSKTLEKSSPEEFLAAGDALEGYWDSLPMEATDV